MLSIYVKITGAMKKEKSNISARFGNWCYYLRAISLILQGDGGVLQVSLAIPLDIYRANTQRNFRLAIA
jgi:hypothetical protein